MTTYVLALDQGTTSSRAILFNRSGEVKGMAQEEFKQYFPQPGWVEHDPLEIWESQLRVARRVLKDSDVAPGQVAAIGIANQRETTIVWDKKTGEPIAPAIVWQDRRTAAFCEELVAREVQPFVQEKTGLLLDPYFSGTKLRWLLDHVPDARSRAMRGELAFGTVDSWLTFKLCGQHVTDAGNASRTLLFNIHTLSWDAELLEMLDIPESMLPKVVPNSGFVGMTEAQLFGAPIPLAGLAGDQQAATYGQACLNEGMAKSTYGTGCFILLNTGSRPKVSKNRLLTTVGWTRDSPSPRTAIYLLEGSVFNGGAVVQWLRDGLGLIRNANEIESLAGNLKDTGGIVFVPAFSGLGAPHWDANARGLIIGITRGTSRAQIAAAALSSIAFQSAEVLACMSRDTGTPLKELRVDGGAARNNLLMQLQADLSDVPVVRPKVTETTALGAAYLAGLGMNFWQSEQEIAANWSVDRVFTPEMSNDERTESLDRWQRAVARSIAWEI